MRDKGKGRSEGSIRKASVIGVVLSLVFILGSSACVFAFTGRYQQVFESDVMKVELRIEMINVQPQKHTVTLSSVKITSYSDSDIVVLEISASVYSGPPLDADSVKFGEDMVKNLLIPAQGTQVVRINEKIYNFELFKDTDHPWVRAYIHWTHMGHIYERIYNAELDISIFQLMFDL